MNPQTIRRRGSSVAATLYICVSFVTTSHAQVVDITAEGVRRHIERLAADSLEGRGAGYRGERQAAEYVAAQFKAIGLEPVGDKRTYFQEFKFQPTHPEKPWAVLTSRNVVGFIAGTDPLLKKEVVVIGGHYDGQGKSGQADPMRSPAGDGSTTDEIWNSANDNATSVAAILEIARAIKSNKLTTKRSILFIAFGAEEHGMAGSIYYVGHPLFPLADHAAMINLEKLGRAPEKPFNVTGTASSPSWKDVIGFANEKTQTKTTTNNPFSFPDSDHYPFAASKIPAVMLYVMGVEAHQPSDTADKIDFARTAEAGRYAMAMLLRIAEAETRPKFAPSPVPDLGLIAHLATAAEADTLGLSAPDSGLKVTGVIPGLPGDTAGLRAGDFITEFAGSKFRREDTVAALMASYAEVLQGKRGNRLTTKFIRDRKPMETVMELRMGK